MACNCRDWTRTFDECNGLPAYIRPSAHAPGCNEFELLDFIRCKSKSQSSGFIDTPENMEGFKADMTEEELADFEFHPIRLTQDQFDSLPEFAGF